MERLYTFNEHNENNKRLILMNKIKHLCSHAVFEYNGDKLEIWYTPTKIVFIEPIDSDIPFKEGDSFKEFYKWAKEKGYNLLKIKRRGKV